MEAPLGVTLHRFVMRHPMLTSYHVYLMTLSQYRDELATIRDLVAMLVSEYRTLGSIVASGECEVRRLSGLINAKRNQISQCRCYRAALHRWFWTSRIGNPPSLAQC